MFAGYTTMSRNYQNIFIAFILIVIVFRTIYLFNVFGSTDLRARYVGARLMAENKSPYFYKWHAGDSEKILDPNINMNRSVNGNVATPAYLLLLRPFIGLPYYYVQLGWGILQCLFLCASIWLLTKFYPLPNGLKSLPSILFIILFSFSDIWLYNIERGQTYTLFAFLFCFIVCLTAINAAKYSLLTGILNGLIGFLRPSFFILLIVFFIRRNFRFCLGQIIGVLVGLVLFVVPYYEVWKDFFNAMHVYGLEIINGMPSYEPIPNTPTIIEGVSTLHSYEHNIKLAGILSVQNYLKNLGITLNSLTSSSICLVIIACYSYFFYKMQLFKDFTKTLLFAFLIFITTEYFFIGARGSYSITQWLLPVYILVINASWKKILLLLLAFSQIFLIPTLSFTNGSSFQGLVGEGTLYFMCIYEIYNNKGQNFAYSYIH